MPDATRLIRILLVEDQPIYRNGLQAVLQEEPGLQVVGEANHGQEALDLLAHTPADVILLDINMPVMDGFQTVPQVQQRYPDTEIIMLTVYDEPPLVLKFLDMEVAGYLLKEANGIEIREAIRTVATGGTYYGLEIMKALTTHLRQQKQTVKPVSLTSREAEVVRLIMQEFTAPEISEKLFISRETVDSHRKNIREKLQVRNTAGIVRETIRRNLIDWQNL